MNLITSISLLYIVITSSPVTTLLNALIKDSINVFFWLIEDLRNFLHKDLSNGISHIVPDKKEASIAP